MNLCSAHAVIVLYPFLPNQLFHFASRGNWHGDVAVKMLNMENDLDNEAKTLLLDSKSKIDSVTKELRESVSELSPDLAAVFDTLH